MMRKTLANIFPKTNFGTRALDLFESIGRSKVPVWIWLMLVWAALIFPAIALRGFHYEEGTVIAIARGAIEDGHWLVPYHYGLRFPERPVLMSWLLALLGLLFGGIDQGVARILPVLSLLGGAALVFYLVRQRASALAALFGAICFMLSPALLQKLVTAEPDAMLSVLLFAAFVIWWDGHKTGRVTFLRWIVVGLVLAAAGLTKGPQPVAYFSFGVGALLVFRRQWKELPGFVLAHVLAGIPLLAWYIAIYQPGDLGLWQAVWRLNSWFGALNWLTDLAHYIAQVALENLPGLILAVPLAVAAFRQRATKPDDLVLALVFYAVLCTAVIALFPGRGARYAMPAALAVATLAGLGYDRFRAQWPRLVDVSVVVGFLLAIYAVAFNWVAMPLRPDLFRGTWVQAEAILAQMRANPAPLYYIFDSADGNILAYMPAPIRVMRVGDFAKMQTPAWAFISPEEAEKARALRPDLSVTLRAAGYPGTLPKLYELRAK